MATAVQADAPSITAPDTVYGPGAGHLHEIIGDNPYPYGECTWYVWQYYHDTQGIDINGQLGNATDWVNSAHREQWQVDDQPVVAKAVSWSAARYPPFGHVAVVASVDSQSFDVLEMNFTYYADENPQLAGKIDRRTVKDRDGILGFITPQGVTVANGQSSEADLMSALSTPFTAIGDAIRQAGLYLEASAMTAELKAQSMGQVALGTAVGGGGLVLGGLALYGGGVPQRGSRRLVRRFRRVQRSVAPRQPSPIGRRSFTETERRWLSPAEVRELERIGREQMAASRRPERVIGPRTPAEIARARAQVLSRARSRQLV